MTDAEFTYAMDIVAAAGRLLLGLGDNIDKALATVEQADAIGPVLDPTGYVTGGSRRLDEQKKVLGPAIAMRDACRALQPDRARR